MAIAFAATTPASHAARRATVTTWPFLLATVVFAVATAGLRLFHIKTAYEIFIDESEYTNIAQSIVSGHGIELFGKPFYLHPPLYFLMLAPAAALATPSTLLDLILEIRYVNVIFAVFNVILIMLLVRRARGVLAATLAGALYALSPFLIKFDSRVTLETSMTTWVLLGLWVLALAIDAIGRRHRALLIAAGVAFGLGLVTKETSAFVTLVPLILIIFSNRIVPRRDSLTVILGQGVTYLVYVGVTAAFDNFVGWWAAKVNGVSRALGLLQVTGYNSPHAPSLLSRISANGAFFFPTYLVIAIGSGTAILLLIRNWRIWSAKQLLAADPSEFGTRSLAALVFWHVATCLSMSYTALFGTLEEQTFYMVAIPATITCGLVLSKRATPRGVFAKLAVTSLAVLVLVWSTIAWYLVHTSRDDAYVRFQNWAQSSIPQGTTIGLTDDNGGFVLTGFVLTKVSSLADAKSTVHYVLVSTSLVDQGLGTASSEFLAQLDRSFTLAHVEHGRTLGELRLYDVRRNKSES